MASPSRRRVWLGWAVSFAASYYVGGVVGFNKGVSTQRALSGGEAVVTMSTVRLIRSGHVAEATRILEGTLDSQLIQGAYNAESYCSAFNMPKRVTQPKVTAVHARSMAVAIQYRQVNPGPNPHGYADLIARLKRYKDAPDVDRSRVGGEGACWPL